MNLKKLVKMLEAETDMEKAAEVLQKIDSVIIKKGVLKIVLGYLYPIELESHICKRDTFEEGYFDCDRGHKWGYPQENCIYIQPDYAGIEIVLSMNEQYVVSCLLKKAYIGLFGSYINLTHRILCRVLNLRLTRRLYIFLSFQKRLKSLPK